MPSAQDAAHYFDPVDQSTYAIDAPVWRSEAGRALLVSDLPGITKADIDMSNRSLWRYAKSLPLTIDAPVSMGEGCTPMVERDFRGLTCKFKLEWFAPTCSFKDRGGSVLISYLKQLGITEVCEDSSGNGGASIAGFGAAAGMKVHILVPGHTPAPKVAQARAFGANVVLVPGDREATKAAALEMAEKIFYASHNWHPMFIQGTKSLGYEIWEDLGFRVPDNIIIPGSAGSLVIGCHLAFAELMRSGEIDRLPKIFITQPTNVAPVHTAFQTGAEDHVDGLEFGDTIAEGTAIKFPLRIKESLRALRETGGGSAAVSEADIQKASLELAGQGLYVEPTCAHAAAGFEQLVKDGTIAKEDETIVVMTGTGLKASGFYADQFED